MRIFYAVDTKPNAALGASGIWHTNLCLSLRDNGHDVVEFEYDLDPHFSHADDSVPANRAFNRIHRPRLEVELLRQVEIAHASEPLDMLFSYFYSTFVSPQVISAVHDMGITTVNWYCNASYQFHLVQDIAPAFDFCLVPERDRLDSYREVGATPIYCPMAANPSFYAPTDVARNLGVVFVGACYGSRLEYVKFLSDRGLPVRVYGPGWTNSCAPLRPLDHARWRARRARNRLLGNGEVTPALPRSVCGPMLSDAEMIAAYSRARITLGFSDVGQRETVAKPITQVRLRDFEATMCGAFYMVQYMEELEELYDIGREIVCYTDKEDLAEKVAYYLAHDCERESVRAAGHRRALQDHTWQKRLRDAFVQMDLET